MAADPTKTTNLTVVSNSTPKLQPSNFPIIRNSHFCNPVVGHTPASLTRKHSRFPPHSACLTIGPQRKSSQVVACHPTLITTNSKWAVKARHMPLRIHLAIPLVTIYRPCRLWSEALGPLSSFYTRINSRGTPPLQTRCESTQVAHFSRLPARLACS